MCWAGLGWCVDAAIIQFVPVSPDSPGHLLATSCPPPPPLLIPLPLAPAPGLPSSMCEINFHTCLLILRNWNVGKRVYSLYLPRHKHAASGAAAAVLVFEFLIGFCPQFIFCLFYHLLPRLRASPRPALVILLFFHVHETRVKF